MAEIILPAGTKMQKLMRAACNGDVSDIEFRILFAIYDAVDRRTGIAEISHDELAAIVGRKRRTIERGTAHLLAIGEIQADRRPVGRRQDGSEIFGGRGGKNCYRVAFERPSGETVLTSERPSPETVNKDRHARHERPSHQTRKTVTPDARSLSPLESHKYPSEALPWERVKICLTERFGPDITRSWFDKLHVADLGDESVTMAAPTKFLRNWISTHYHDDMLACWQTEMPAMKRIEFVVRANVQSKPQLVRDVNSSGQAS